MSKITVTTIAGQTSGSDANKVKIESGDTLQVESNATVGGTLAVTGGTTLSSTANVGNVLTLSGNDFANSISMANGGTGGTTFTIFSTSDAYAQPSANWMLHHSSASNGIILADQNGRVRIPYQPSFQAKTNIANLTLSNYAGATYHLNIFNNEFFDIGSNFNTTNSTFTAPVAGRYYFYTQLQLSGSPTTSDHSWGINLHFQVNGAGNHANGYQSLSTSQGGGSTTLFGAYGLAVKENILNLAANDTVRVALSGNANINAGTVETVTNDGRCRFGGHLLG